jgi:hypothetical protein
LYRTAPVFQRHRVAWPDLATTVTAVAIDEVDRRAVPLNTCYVVAFPDQGTALAVSTILNSIWISAFVRVTADEARGGYRRCNSRVMGQIPVPDVQHHPSLTDVGRRAHHTDDVSTDEVDAAVATALGLPASVQSRLRSLAPNR